MEAIKKWGRDFPAHQVGTGPFRFVSWQKGVRLVLEKNPGYWGGAPRLDELVFVALPEAATRFVAVKTGTADLTIDVPVDELANLQRAPGFRVELIPSTQVLFVAFNMRMKPLDDVRVRRALNLAVDKETIVTQVLKGTGVSARGPISPAFGELFDRSLPGFPYAPDRARQLLQEAAWPADRVLTFTVPESGSGMQAPQAIGTMIQANLQAVGVRTAVRTFEWGTYLARFRAGEYDLGMLAWNLGAVGDPVVMLSGLVHSGSLPPKGWNSGGYAKQELDGLLDAYRRELIPARRAELLRQAQRLTQEDPPWIYVDHQILPVVMSRRVKNVRVHPSLLFVLSRADVEE
jgi:peptide/nickel transport system substrate-binding protein